MALSSRSFLMRTLFTPLVFVGCASLSCVSGCDKILNIDAHRYYVDAGPTGGCQTNKECTDQMGEAATCRQDKHTCVPVITSDCVKVFGDITNPNAVILGVCQPFLGAFATSGGPAVNGIELALNEINMYANGLPGRNGGPPRPLVAVECDEVTEPDVAATHLVEDVGVTSILGCGFSSATIKVLTDVAVPNNILMMSSLSSSDALTTFADNHLFWRTFPPLKIESTPYALLVPQLEALVRQARSLTASDRVKVSIPQRDDVFGSGFANATVPQIVLNGEPATSTDNMPDFDWFTYPATPTDPTYSAQIARIRDFEPDIILWIGTNEVVQTFLNSVETAWNAGVPRPYHLLNRGAKLQDLLTKIGTDQELQQRVLGTSVGGKGPVYESFALRYKAKFNVDAGRGAEYGYDAAYLVAYAHALAGPGATGPKLADAMTHMSSGPQVVAGPDGINNGFMVLLGGQMDYVGASGDLNFDNNTGSAPADVQIWCVTNDATGAAAFKNAGSYFSYMQNQIIGTTLCQ
jgi:branched-chain amino acid transport system substrate-binding protein